MIEFTQGTLDKIAEYADGSPNEEACGFVTIGETGEELVVKCVNEASDSRTFFLIGPKSFAKHEGRIKAVWHSHNTGHSEPSPADRAMCESSKLPFVIVAETGREDKKHEFHSIEPCGWVAELIGRQFVYGVHDCYTLIRDYYYQQFEVVLPDVYTEFGWWNAGKNLYLDGYEAEGFIQVDRDQLKEHDVILMQMGSPVPNHGAVYIGGGIILHHMGNRLSRRDLYNEYYRKTTALILRHKSQL